MITEEDITREIEESITLQKAVLGSITGAIAEAAQMIIDGYKAGNKVLLAGNGGSAADAQHLAAEMTGRFLKERKALPAIALTTDTSALTAISNDYGYENVFSRQVEALAKEGDILVAMTTSGASSNILAAAATAREYGLKVIVMTGERGITVKDNVNLLIAVPSDKSPRIQEAHITIGHIIFYLVERELFSG